MLTYLTRGRRLAFVILFPDMSSEQHVSRVH